MINDLPDDVICNIAIFADGTTPYSKCDQASNSINTIYAVSDGCATQYSSCLPRCTQK